MTDYQSAGVSIEANDEAVELIRQKIDQAGATRAEVLSSGAAGRGAFSGAFAARFDAIEEPVILSTTDGVGTKLTIAQTLDRHDTVGFDAVAMVVDDLVCDGGEPLFVLDYISCGRNIPERTATIVEGVARACAFAGCALIGGEISEHPGVMADDEYDLVAFAVGVADRSKMIGAALVHEGDMLIGLASSGLHSNGYSLVRRLILDHDLTLSMRLPSGQTLGEELLEPCRIHAPAVLSAVRSGLVHAAAHVTGGGIAANVARVMPQGLGARIDPTTWQRHSIFDFLQQTGDIEESEMRRVFNLGIGMVLVVGASDVDTTLGVLGARGETAMVIGEVVRGDEVEIA